MANESGVHSALGDTGEQLRLTIEAIKERQESELVNNTDNAYPVGSAAYYILEVAVRVTWQVGWGLGPNTRARTTCRAC